MKTARFWSDKGGELVVVGVCDGNLQADFHAYYTNDVMIFDVAAGVWNMWKQKRTGWVEGGCFSLSLSS